MNLFTGLVDRCFKECANDFTTKAVTKREVFIKIKKYEARMLFIVCHRMNVSKDVQIDF
jgi:hypothetical protein